MSPRTYDRRYLIAPAFVGALYLPVTTCTRADSQCRAVRAQSRACLPRFAADFARSSNSLAPALASSACSAALALLAHAHRAPAADATRSANVDATRARLQGGCAA